MSIEGCIEKSKGEKDPRVSFVLCRSAELRKGKTVVELSQSKAMEMAHKEYDEWLKKNP